MNPPDPARLSRRTFGTLLGAFALGAATRVLALELPKGPVVLTLTGRVRNTNQGARAAFDMAMLERLPQHSFRTRTPWYPQARKFTGPLLRDLLTAVGAEGTVVRALALNDYRVDLPIEDAQSTDVIVARLIDDKPMAVRDKGPLFIIFPFDSRPDLRNAIYYSRSAWQLTTLDVQ